MAKTICKSVKSGTATVILIDDTWENTTKSKISFNGLKVTENNELESVNRWIKETKSIRV